MDGSKFGPVIFHGHRLGRETVFRAARVLAALSAALFSSGAGAAGYEARSSIEIQPLDCIQWAHFTEQDVVVPNPAQGVSENGVPFTVSKPAGGPMSVLLGSLAGFADQGCVLSSRNSASVLVQFEKPLIAVGAEVQTDAAMGSVTTLRAYDANGTLVAISQHQNLEPGAQFVGLVSTAGDIREVEFSNSLGVVSLGRIDLRPAPISAPDRFQLFENSLTSASKSSVLANDSFASTSVLTQSPAHADVFRLGEDGTFVYKPAKDFNGSDRFVYEAVDASGRVTSPPTVVDIDVTPVNSEPLFSAAGDVSVDEDAGPQVIPGWASDISAGAPDEASQRLTWKLDVDNPKLFSEVPTLDGTGNLKFTSAPYSFGIANVTVRLQDDGGTENGGVDISSPVHFTIEIRPGEHAPLLNRVPDQRISEGQLLDLKLAASDPDYGQVVTYKLLSGPAGATLDPISGRLVWTPGCGVAGERARFKVAAVDGYGGLMSDEQEFAVVVTPPNHPPTIQSIGTIVARPGQQIRFHVHASDEDAGDKLHYFLGSTSSGPRLDPDSGEFLWTPNKSQIGKSLKFWVSVCDGGSPRLSSMESFTVTVSSSPKPAKGDAKRSRNKQR